MATLITRLRVVVGDPAGASQVFSDDELEDFLDERRADVDLALLRADTRLSGSPTVFRAPVRWWETDHVLADGSGSALTPTVGGTDALAGVWTFATAQSGRVYITGRYYDLYGSAAAVLQAWAAKVSREFDFATDGQRFDRSQKREGLLATAREYARKAIPPGMRPTWGLQTWET
jgi:hypothetical protein